MDVIGEETDMSDIINEHIHEGHPHVKAILYGSGIADSVDWREHGAVTPVVDQGFCGSCWAISVAGMLEGAYSIKTGKPAILLSFQQIIDCVRKEKHFWRSSKGCKGGIVSEALYYFQTSYINEASKYPYRERMKKCRQFGFQLSPEKEEKRIFMQKIDKILGRDQNDKQLSFKMKI